MLTANTSLSLSAQTTNSISTDWLFSVKFDIYRIVMLPCSVLDTLCTSSWQAVIIHSSFYLWFWAACLSFILKTAHSHCYMYSYASLSNIWWVLIISPICKRGHFTLSLPDSFPWLYFTTNTKFSLIFPDKQATRA